MAKEVDVKDLLKQAIKYSQDGKIDKAIEIYQSVAKKTPKDAKILNSLGDLYLRKKMMAEASTIFADLAQLYEDDGYTLRAIAICQKVLKIDPDSHKMKIKMAELYAKQGLVAEARAQYLDLANFYDKKGSVKEALEVFRKLADLDPTNLSVRSKLGNMFHKEGMATKAAAEWVKASEGYLKSGQTNEAGDLLNKAVQSDPGNAKARFLLASEEIKKDNFKRVVELLQPAAGGHAADLEVLKLYAAALLKTQNYKEAAAILTRAVEKEPASLPIRENLGLALLKAGNPREALEHILKAIVGHMKENRWERAEKLALEVADEGAADAQILQKLVEIYTHTGQKERLISAYGQLAAQYEARGLKKNVQGIYHKLLEIDPDNPEWLSKLEEDHAPPPVTRAAPAPPPDEEELVPIEIDLGEAPSAPDQLLAVEPQAGLEEEEIFIEGEEEAEPVAASPMAEVERFLKRGLFKEAETKLQEMISVEPSPDKLRMLKEIYRNQDRARAYIKVCFDLAALLKREGREKEAVAEYQDVLKIDQGNEKAKEALADIVLALGGRAPQFAAEEVEEPTEAAGVDVLEIPEVDLESFAELDLDRMAGTILGDIRPETAPPTIAPKAAAEGAETVKPAAKAPKEERPPAPAMAPAADDVADLLAEADFYFHQGLYNEARKLYADILSRRPGHVEASQRLASLADRQPEAAAPTEAFSEQDLAAFSRKMEEDFPPAFKTAKFKVSDETEAAPAQNMEFGDFLTSLKEELEGPAKPPPPPPQEDFQDILREFQKGVKEHLSDEDYETHYNLGIAYKEMGLLDEAVAEFEQAACGEQYHLDSVSMIALCYKDKGELEKAAAALRLAVSELNPRHEGRKGLLWEMAGIYEAMGEKQKAVDTYLSVYEMDDAYRGIQDKLKDLGALGSQAPKESLGVGAPAADEKEPLEPKIKKSSKVSYI